MSDYIAQKNMDVITYSCLIVYVIKGIPAFNWIDAKKTQLQFNVKNKNLEMFWYCSMHKKNNTPTAIMA